MSAVFNADEILEMAVKIEQNGRAFYTEASKRVENEDLKKLLTNLAKWESQHEKLFTKMKAKFEADREVTQLLDPDSEATRYLQAIADGQVFSKEKLDEELAEITDYPTAILNRALQREKDAIVFFVAMKESVPAPLSSDDVDKIIHEEYSHIRYLKNLLENF